MGVFPRNYGKKVQHNYERGGVVASQIRGTFLNVLSSVFVETLVLRDETSRLRIIFPSVRFLLAGLSDGSMAFVSIEQKRLLTSFPLAAPNSLVASTFSGPPTSATMTLASVEGLLYVFTSVQLDRFHQALEAGDMEGLQAAQGAIERSVAEVDCEVAGALHLPCVGDSAGVLLLTEHGILRPSQHGEQDDLLPKDVLQNQPKKVSEWWVLFNFFQNHFF